MSFKAGFVGLIGLPNAGKSTLLNALVGDKISIVSKKPQTTRRRITGLFTTDAFQAIFVDAPGVIQDTKGLNSFLVEEYQDVIKHSDVVVGVISLDVKSPEPLEGIINIIHASRKPHAVLITKKDLRLDHRASILKTKLEDLNIPFVEICAKDIEATQLAVGNLVAPLLPDSPAPLYSEDILTTESSRFIASEMIREKCFDLLFEELPYESSVLIRKYEETPGPVIITADLIVERESHKKIVIGHKGEMIKAIGTAARQDIEKLLGTKVFLDLHVVVKKQWNKNKFLMEELGYVVQK